MIRKKREVAQVDLFVKENILPEEPSFLSKSAETGHTENKETVIKKIQIERTFKNPILMGEFNGTAEHKKDESTENAVREIHKRDEVTAEEISIRASVSQPTEEISLDKVFGRSEQAEADAFPAAAEEVKENSGSYDEIIAIAAEEPQPQAVTLSENSEDESQEAVEVHTKPGIIPKEAKPKIINRDFSEGFYLTEEARIKAEEAKRARKQERRARRINKLAVKTVSVLLLLFFVMVLFNWQEWVVNSSLFSLRNVYVQGNLIGSKEDIIKAADLDMGRRLAEIDLTKTADRIKMNPLFEHVTVSRNYPSSVVITVKEREPFAFLPMDELYPVDANGFVLPKLKARMIYNLPVISGMTGVAQPGKKFKNDRLPLALQFLAKAKEADESLFYDISEVVVNKKDMTVFLNSRHVAFRIEDEELMRAAVYLSAAAQHFKQEDDAVKGTREVDLRYNGQIFLRN
ncbi:MAG TPA: FtsQ-type POTRA domain-containing protein [bacterium]|nr:FtsQ-type POTRA domain-containing protein [bacterium]